MVYPFISVAHNHFPFQTWIHHNSPATWHRRAMDPGRSQNHDHLEEKKTTSWSSGTWWLIEPVRVSAENMYCIYIYIYYIMHIQVHIFTWYMYINKKVHYIVDLTIYIRVENVYIYNYIYIRIHTHTRIYIHIYMFLFLTNIISTCMIR